MLPQALLERILAQTVFAKEAALTQHGYYKEKRKAALNDQTLSGKQRRKLMRSYLKDRGADKWKTVRQTLGHGASGVVSGAFLAGAAGASGKGARSAAMASGLLHAAVGGGLSERNRRTAGRAAEDPAQVRALVQRANKPRKLRQRSRLIRDHVAARRGERPTGGRALLTTYNKSASEYPLRTLFPEIMAKVAMSKHALAAPGTMTVTVRHR